MPRKWVPEKNKFYSDGRPRLKRKKIGLIIEKICGFLTGHEISKTEFGYGGKGTIDRNCRWCDKVIQIPISENVVSKNFKNLMDWLDENKETS
jgi:hypothetical protein